MARHPDKDACPVWLQLGLIVSRDPDFYLPDWANDWLEMMIDRKCPPIWLDGMARARWELGRWMMGSIDGLWRHRWSMMDSWTSMHYVCWMVDRNECHSR